MICDSCGHERPIQSYIMPAIIDEERGTTYRQVFRLCDECAFSVSKNNEKELKYD